MSAGSPIIKNTPTMTRSMAIVPARPPSNPCLILLLPISGKDVIEEFPGCPVVIYSPAIETQNT